jgi:hypothetical protein
VTGQPTEIDDHDPLAHDTLEVLTEFIDEIGRRGCTSHFDKVVTGKHYLKGKHLLQEPERFIEDHLAFPLLGGPLNHMLRPRPKQYAPRWPRQGGVPDFCLTTVPIDDAMDADLRAFGEVKPPKKMERAREDMSEYLNKDLDFDAITILTDGFEWELWVRPNGQPVEEDEEPYAKMSLRRSLKAIQDRNMEVDSLNPHSVRTDYIDTGEFSKFSAESVSEIVENKSGVSLPREN